MHDEMGEVLVKYFSCGAMNIYVLLLGSLSTKNGFAEVRRCPRPA